jgi:hypothetical protein
MPGLLTTGDTSHELIPGTDFLAPKGIHGADADFIFLADFIEDTNRLVPGQSTFSILATVTLSAAGTTVGPVTVGPIEVQVPQIPIPTIAVFFRHSFYRASSGGHAGWVFVMVPEDARYRTLNQLGPVLTNLQTTLANLKGIAKIAGFLLGISNLIDALDAQPMVQFAAANQIDKLEDITFVEGHWYHVLDLGLLGSVPDLDADDGIWAMMMIGVPGREIDIFDNEGQVAGDGALQVATGAEMWAALETFNWNTRSAAAPFFYPASARLVVDGTPSTFAGQASSIAFA